MTKIKQRLKNYFKTKSRWKIAGDLIFYIFLILLIIPATRKPISTGLIRLTMLKPKVENSRELPSITEADKALAFVDMDGNTYTLEDFDGEVILLNFWATWCPPCRAEMPSLQNLYDDYGNKIKMILITSEEEQVVADYLNEYNYQLPVYFHRGGIAPSFQVRSIPTTYLISKQGNILTEKTGAANWNSASFKEQLDELIDQPG
jgi:thiol-disulfide isomerase/thioredoxin